MKWNESGFRPPLCIYRLNWARRTSWGWWDEWEDTVLQTHSKFEPWPSEAEHATSRSRRLPTRGWGRNIFVSYKSPRPGTEPRTLALKAAVLTTILGPPPWICITMKICHFCPATFSYIFRGSSIVDVRIFLDLFFWNSSSDTSWLCAHLCDIFSCYIFSRRLSQGRRGCSSNARF